MAKYPQVHDGDVIQPKRKGYKMACCDCGLVHKFNFFLAKMGKKNFIRFEVFRDNRATAAVRRHRKNK